RVLFRSWQRGFPDRGGAPGDGTAQGSRAAGAAGADRRPHHPGHQDLVTDGLLAPAPGADLGRLDPATAVTARLQRRQAHRGRPSLGHVPLPPALPCVPPPAVPGRLAYAYLGDTDAGIGIGLRDFWKLVPTQLDVSAASTDLGAVTAWLYAPSAEPMDLRFYHDGLGQDTYA